MIQKISCETAGSIFHGELDLHFDDYDDGGCVCGCDDRDDYDEAKGSDFWLPDVARDLKLSFCACHDHHHQ